MTDIGYYNSEIETMERGDLDALVEERIKYTLKYAYENSPFYYKWFKKNNIDFSYIRTHEDLQELPIITGSTVRNRQPPETKEFEFKCGSWDDIYTIHETSGTSGQPKSFFLTWEDWQRYAEKYSRAFTSQGFGTGDRVVVCASYGMNVGANTMTLAAKNIGMTIIPTGKCTFPVRLMKNYEPTGIVASIFKLLRLARRMKKEGLDPQNSSIKRLIAGGESFSPEARDYVEELWGVKIFNTYGSTEGTMCGECHKRVGLHVPEDMVHLDVYNPMMKDFVPDGEYGRIVLTTLLPVGGKTGTLLLNYDTDDTTVVVSRDKCACGRTHMRIMNPQREAETFWISGNPFNRVDVEQGVFQRENMDYLTGEYESFIYGDEDEGEITMRVSLECGTMDKCDQELIENNFIKSFFQYKPGLQQAYSEGTFDLLFNFTGPGDLEFYRIKGRPRRVVDRR
ncbi:MAG: coenzyme F390 synthetase [Euryarchaeota archaeon]|nr:coenzyme F390 synthetase [Euryarchaeota archaeon]MBU4547433.1 coenzyme F390 synthetase [Euryarchaeota archaeon]MBU4607196.1 coenzyme F390 synthetase [Euryarchaeota archaeon]MBV1729485.1 coenzyme F390 synthetase [Methanobacterium sp.]MBV1755226.1 coenzyme F390 synthetase [Methanobacterium sp.]